MPVLPILALGLSALVALTQTASGLKPDPAMVCPACDEWNGPREPFKVFGNTYFVGPAGVSAVLITSPQGHVLLDGGLSQSAAHIDRSIRALGFRTEDVRVIGASHEHYDHVGGIAALQRLSGAQVAHSAPGARALAQGMPLDSDPQIALGRDVNAFPAVSNVRVVADGETLRVGPIAITAHTTPGHTPGAVTWSWRSCEGDRCLDIVYVDSLNPISSGRFRFTGNDGRPDVVPAFRASLAKVAALPCDILIAVHPAAADLDGKLKRRASNPTTDPMVDPSGCRTYAASLSKRLETRVASEAR